MADKKEVERLREIIRSLTRQKLNLEDELINALAAGWARDPEVRAQIDRGECPVGAECDRTSFEICPKCFHLAGKKE